jgi:hypothetical protein
MPPKKKTKRLGAGAKVARPKRKTKLPSKLRDAASGSEGQEEIHTADIADAAVQGEEDIMERGNASTSLESQINEQGFPPGVTKEWIQAQIKATVQTELKEQFQNLENSLNDLVRRAIGSAVGALPATAAPTPAPAAAASMASNTGPEVSNVQDENIIAAGTLDNINLASNAGAAKKSAPNVLMSSTYNALQAKVPQKLKDKIWAGEYIDLASLLDPEAEVTYHLAMSKDPQSTNCLFDMVPQNKKVLASISQWDQAFTTYMAVYVVRFPDEMSDLLQYTFQIKQMSRNNGAWRLYDETFRRHRESSLIPWNSTLMDKWLECSNAGRSAGQVPKQQYSVQKSQGWPIRKGPNQPFRRKGVCHKFNDGKECRGCIFSHTCEFCDGNHRGIHCRRSSQNQSQAPQQQSQRHGAAPNARGRQYPL